MKVNIQSPDPGGRTLADDPRQGLGILGAHAMFGSEVIGYHCPKPIFDGWQPLLLGMGYSLEEFREERRSPGGMSTLA